MSVEDRSSLSEAATQVAELDVQLKNSVIMMVDDEPILMEVLQAFLELQGYNRFITLDDSRHAMDMLEQEQPDVLLLDLKMPEVSGFEILKKIRASERLKRLPVIVLTSSSDAETKLSALELGATDFLAKPVDASELALRLRNTLTVKAYQDQLAHCDALTGLPNRSRFLDRLDWSLKNAERVGDSVAVLKLSVDRFKQINDTLGPKAGDALLQDIAGRLTTSVRSSDVVSHTGRADLWQNIARLGGDEFSILLPGGLAGEDAAFVAKRLLQKLKEPCELDGQSVYISGSIGIAVYPDDATDADTLMKNASAATEHSKDTGRDTYRFYSKELNRKNGERLRIEADLRQALDNNEFVLYYQPKVCVKTQHVLGMEALIRWMHPKEGFLSPFKFIQVAEDCGLISPIGEWVIIEACRQNKEWQEKGLPELKVSVNVSPQQFLDKNFARTVASILSSDMNLQLLVLEITEGMLMGAEERLINIMHDIQQSGPQFSIDDFGTGYSSLSYLKRYPLSELKIDRAFLLDVPAKKDDCAIVSAIIALAHSLELTVVAEGVERVDQVEFLKQKSCDLIQGFYYSKPLPANEFEAFVRQRANTATS